MSKRFSSILDLSKSWINKIHEKLQKNCNHENESIKNSLRSLDNIISEHKEIIITNELMKDERFPLSEIRDIINYFYEDQNINDKQIEFIIEILEAFIDFLENKMKIIEKHAPIKVDDYTYKDEFIKDYNTIFMKYNEMFDKQDLLFYEKYYIPKGNYDKAINETFRLLGDSQYFYRTNNIS
ncbi:MAG: hypothetical protein LBT10_08385 [Methanobrevibacter sp.]|nr:hypothetical protein [Methanobrevibacter sp.]